MNSNGDNTICVWMICKHKLYHFTVANTRMAMLQNFCSEWGKILNFDRGFTYIPCNAADFPGCEVCMEEDLQYDTGSLY